MLKLFFFFISNKVKFIAFFSFTIQVLILCFKLYGSRDPSIHSMAGVAIRQIVSALFERVSKSTEEACGEGVELGAGQNMPSHTRDAYLLFQVYTFVYVHNKMF